MTAAKKIDWNKVEERIYAEQFALIKKRYGKKVADAANYGWGVDVAKNGVDVCTKIYGHGTLTSSAHRSNLRTAHHWEVKEE